MELGGNNGGRGGREAESAGKKVGQARERDGVGARQGEEGRGRSRREEMAARRRRAASAAPSAAELCSAHRRAPHERGKGNGEAKSNLAIATAMERLSGAGSRRHGDAWHRRLCTPSRWQEQESTVTVFKHF